MNYKKRIVDQIIHIRKEMLSTHKMILSMEATLHDHIFTLHVHEINLSKKLKEIDEIVDKDLPEKIKTLTIDKYYVHRIGSSKRFIKEEILIEETKKLIEHQTSRINDMRKDIDNMNILISNLENKLSNI